MKAHILVDFIPELTPTIPIEAEKKEEWKVWVDGTSGSTDLGIGILLLGPHLIKLRYAAKLKFTVTNNVVEYEALLMVLRITNQLGATKAKIFCDSQLVVNQCQGSFQVKDPNLAKYEVRVKRFFLSSSYRRKQFP